MVTAYLLKGIRIVRTEQDKITTFNFSNLNLEDRNMYGMLSPYKYLTRTKRKNSKIIPQPWTMKIRHFGRHQEVNACVNMLLSCYHGG
jgi:hypothetical protein